MQITTCDSLPFQLTLAKKAQIAQHKTCNQQDDNMIDESSINYKPSRRKLEYRNIGLRTKCKKKCRTLEVFSPIISKAGSIGQE